MRYGRPAIAEVLDRLKAEAPAASSWCRCTPRYAASTTATALDKAGEWLARARNQPEIRAIRSFCDGRPYLAALEQTVRSHWQTHGLPAAAIACSSVFTACRGAASTSATPTIGMPKTGRLLAERLGLPADRFALCFQSRLAGRMAPATPPLRQWGREGGASRCDLPRFRRRLSGNPRRNRP